MIPYPTVFVGCPSFFVCYVLFPPLEMFPTTNKEQGGTSLSTPRAASKQKRRETKQTQGFLFLPEPSNPFDYI